ncbi:hypothetical protein BGZ61DRAFT_532389 [Ilyonectria robusta]|uniref:uncharacterized protein n=1 Tax=Ilyonectria robusta TaxID=1079257 RepID=UPI001E8EBA19|nr:uncharacterized protein BGZ61DRAFT_532389 [Ilyonectria robusta]KAH8699963.1 hypothetical protein BGZ61DRAFT_532389 [Ilyonectria robusta]
MAAINSLITREAVHQLVRRKNWPAKNVGVMVVFCIVAVVAIFLIGLWISKVRARRQAAKPSEV